MDRVMEADRSVNARRPRPGMEEDAASWRIAVGSGGMGGERGGGYF